MTRALLPFWLLLSLLAPSLAVANVTADETAIRLVLENQVGAWNRKDLEGYMAGYWHSPDLSFYSGGTVTRGWQATLDRYRKRYQGDGKEMGSLTFDDLSVEPLGTGAAMARGVWKLRMSDGKQLKGLFTVILRKLPEGWRIVHDHSSVE